jgi:hypothetical protein
MVDEGGIPDVPWASVFDPELNLKAVSAIQARGFRAASDVVNRLLKAADSVSTKADGEQHDGREGQDGNQTRSSPPDVDRLLATWQSMVGQVAASLRELVIKPATGNATFDLVTSEARGDIALETAGPGTASTEVWLHNRGATDLGKVRLRCSDLLAHDGALIEASAVRFEPDTVPMPARCSRGVTVEIDVGEGISPGHYRGTLLADGAADVWLPVALVVNSDIS